MFRSRKVFVSLRRLKIHEFHSTLRYVHKSGNWVDLFEKLVELQKQAVASFLRLCYPLLIAYLIIFSLNTDGEVGITIQGISAAIPTAHFAITTSLIFLFATMSLIHLLIVFSLRARLSSQIMLPGFSVGIFGLLRGEDTVALSLPVIQNLFLKELFPTSRILAFFLSIALEGLLIPFFAFGCYIISVQYELVFLEDISGFERVTAIFGIGLIIYSIIYFIVFHVPLPMVKNRDSLRWSFLNIISRKFPHPQTDFWLADKRK